MGFDGRTRRRAALRADQAGMHPRPGRPMASILLQGRARDHHPNRLSFAAKKDTTT